MVRLQIVLDLVTDAAACGAVSMSMAARVGDSVEESDDWIIVFLYLEFAWIGSLC